jgi:hypothetical protein
VVELNLVGCSRFGFEFGLDLVGWLVVWLNLVGWLKI